ncbi:MULTISPECIES: restriction endonuclease subunit S [Streptococcus]|uniref:restriction endonuclease subunit S n=1 Tax=Streptococcus TaxID=1301 RepID=UPI000F5E2742|nr:MULTISPECIES: restriction endonuclease subunit S [Streptococcus]RRD33571.1 restriction endonuclease subunit S [Streptococcus sp. OH4692_COT-348]
MTRMKESGIDWIGQIPEEWEMSKIRYLVTTRSEKRITDSSVPYIGLENIESQTGKFVKTGIQVDKSENIVVEIGDVLFGKLRPYLRKYWRATFTSTASSEFLVFQSSELDMNFLYYAIQSDSFIEEVNTSTYGSKMPRASWEYIKNMRIAFPTSLVEQQKIADFLDKKIVQLDKVKSLLEEQIQKLKDYRASLIYETVTKGLDKTVPMKDSGVDWIGQIPQGWGVIKFKYLGDVKQGLTYSPSDIVDKDEGILVLRSGNIQNGILDFNNNVYVKTKVAESIVLRKNDILITARNGSPVLIGKNAIIDTDIKATFGAFMMVFRANKSLFAKFAFYLMNVSFNFYRTFFTTSTVNQLTAAIFNGIEVPLPSIYEQKKITDFLDQKTVQIDKLIQIKNQQIENINKQRQTLIYDYVTGKRRV